MLWLSGLGIEVIYGRVRQSTDNALVERCNGVLAQWTDPAHQADFETFCEALEWAGHTQRERYRSRQHVTRMEAYPDLYTNPRTYHRRHDAQLWQVDRAAAVLGCYTLQRQVEKNGRINLMANTYSVGRSFARQIVTARLDEQSYEWVISDAYGRPIRRHRSKELDYDSINRFAIDQ
jgi:hypothetical protein